MPPEVPATVRAGVVVGVATEISPPVKLTLVTVPELEPQPVQLVTVRAPALVTLALDPKFS